jgi:flagellin-like protein
VSSSDASRGVSPVLATVLLVAVAVVVAAVTAGYAFDVASDVSEPGPTVGETSGELLADKPGSGDQVLRLTHVAGDELPVTDLAVAVDASDACGKQSRIVDAPTNTLGSANFEGADIFDYYSPEDGVLEPGGGGVWRPGTTIQFRLASTECNISPGERVSVRIVHVPSRTVAATTTLTAT